MAACAEGDQWAVHLVSYRTFSHCTAQFYCCQDGTGMMWLWWLHSKPPEEVIFDIKALSPDVIFQYFDLGTH